MSNRKTNLLAAVALVSPIFLSLAAGEALAAPSEADSYVQSAQELIKKNDLKGAEIQFRNAVQKAPTDPAIRMQLAELYIRVGNTSAAEAELLVAKQRGAAPDRLTVLLAEVMFRNGETGQLLRELPAGNRAPAVESVVRTYRGMAQLALGDTNAAEAAMADAERLDPKALGPKLAMARLLLSKADYAAAEKKIDEALVIAPRDSQSLDVKGITLMGRGDLTGALNFSIRP
jgi:Flp pilus assembly protein TadD